MNKTRVGIIGQGYVGLNLAYLAAPHYQITGFDNNEILVKKLNEGTSQIEGVDGKILKNYVYEGAYTASTDFRMLRNQQVIVIAVPTPLDANREPDLSYLLQAAENIGKYASEGTLIINESTSFPGTLRELIIPTISSISSSALYFASSPERINPGSSNLDSFDTPRLVSGIDQESTKRALNFYKKFTPSLTKTSSPEIAEMAKILENTFRQVNIGLVNELALICSKFGLNIFEVIEAASTKPFGFMKFLPSMGVGGHCIPIDPIYLKAKANKIGVKTQFIDLANSINREMPMRIVEKIQEDISIENKKITIVGLAYKSNVADTRESPALEIISILKSLNCKVYWHDPVVKEFKGEISQPLGNSDIYIINTLHDEIDIRDLESLDGYVFDCTGRVKNAETF